MWNKTWQPSADGSGAYPKDFGLGVNPRYRPLAVLEQVNYPATYCSAATLHHAWWPRIMFPPSTPHANNEARQAQEDKGLVDLVVDQLGARSP